MFEERVQRGMDLLDEYFGTGDWVFSIDLGELEMSSTCSCIVGQLVGWNNLKNLIPDEEFNKIIEIAEEEDVDYDVIGKYGFDLMEDDAHLPFQSNPVWRELEEAWIKAIKERIDEGVKV